MRLLLRNKSITQKKAIPTSHDVALAVVRLGVRIEASTAAWAVEADSEVVCVARCIRLYARNVAKIPRYLSSLVVIGPCIAAIATALDAIRAPAAAKGRAASIIRLWHKTLTIMLARRNY